MFEREVIISLHGFFEYRLFRYPYPGYGHSGRPWANLRVLGNNTGCVCDSFDIEYSLYGTPSASFVLGDGTEIPLSVTGSLTDTITDTLFNVAFCNLGSLLLVYLSMI